MRIAGRRSAWQQQRGQSMRALRWHGKHDIRCDSVPDPAIEEGRDAIVRVTSCAICGSDLHLFGGFLPGMKSGDIIVVDRPSTCACRSPTAARSRCPTR
jgi:hypothetical protein